MPGGARVMQSMWGFLLSLANYRSVLGLAGRSLLVVLFLTLGISLGHSLAVCMCICKRHARELW